MIIINYLTPNFLANYYKTPHNRCRFARRERFRRSPSKFFGVCSPRILLRDYTKISPAHHRFDLCSIQNPLAYTLKAIYKFEFEKRADKNSILALQLKTSHSDSKLQLTHTLPHWKLKIVTGNTGYWQLINLPGNPMQLIRSFPKRLRVGIFFQFAFNLYKFSECVQFDKFGIATPFPLLKPPPRADERSCQCIPKINHPA